MKRLSGRSRFVEVSKGSTTSSTTESVFRRVAKLKRLALGETQKAHLVIYADLGKCGIGSQARYGERGLNF